MYPNILNANSGYLIEFTYMAVVTLYMSCKASECFLVLFVYCTFR